MMDMMNNGMSGWGMMLLPLFFWVLIIAGVVLIVLWLLGRKKESALDILKQRYARGEIDKAAFERMKKDISEGEES
ncbi:MAG: SHOCT domain-containing protein [Mariprofundaceae bacterium]